MPELKSPRIVKSISDVSGGSIILFLGVYSYLTDVTTSENRTLRIAVMDGLIWVGWYIGNLLSGPIKKNLGLKYNFIFALVCSVISFLYTWFFVKESRPNQSTASGEIRLSYFFRKLNQICVNADLSHVFFAFSPRF